MKTLRPKPYALSKDNLKIVFFGTPQIGKVVLEELINNNLKPILVITREDKPAGRGHKPSPPAVKILSQKHKIEVLQPKKLKDNPAISHKLYAISPNLGVVAAYGRIIPKDVIDAHKFGILNVHPSLLPKYRGASPIQSPILNAEKETGVSIMLLDEDMDHGPIVAQQKVKIGPDDNQITLSEKLSSLGAEMLVKVIPKWINSEIKAKPQNHSKATFTKMFTKQDGYIDPKNPPTKEKLDRMIRAFYPWPGVWTEIENVSKSQRVKESKKMKIKFLPSNIDTSTHRHIGTFLIQPEGKHPLTITELKNGYPDIAKQLEGLI